MDQIALFPVEGSTAGVKPPRTLSLAHDPPVPPKHVPSKSRLPTATLATPGGARTPGPPQILSPTCHPPGSLTLSRMLALNAVVCGLEFCASAAFGSIPPLLLKAGIEERSMTLVLAVGPALGFFLVPVIGRASDRCRSRFGRRRPFIAGLSVALVASLFIVAYGDAVARTLFGSGTLGSGACMTLLVVGATTLDFSCQTCLTPCEALISDASHGTGQHERAFTVYSLAVSAGGCVGYFITSLDWRASPLGAVLGSQEHCVFMLLAALYTLSATATFLSSSELPVLPELSGGADVEDGSTRGLLTDAMTPMGGGIDPGYVSDDVASSEEGGSPMLGEKLLPLSIVRSGAAQGLVARLRGAIGARMYAALPDVIKALLDVPLVLRRLALANFFSWTAVMAFNLFFTDFVAHWVYGGDPSAPEGSLGRERYDLGVRAGSVGLLLHCIAAAAYAPVVERLALRIGLRATYGAGMATFAVCMGLMLCVQSAWAVNAVAACTGFAYATLTTVPFMLVTAYHDCKDVYFQDTILPGMGGMGGSGGRPQRGFGTDLATLDSAYFLSQVVLTMFMGSIVHWTGSVGAYMLSAGAAGCCALLCVRRIVCDKAHMQDVVRQAAY